MKEKIAICGNTALLSKSIDYIEFIYLQSNSMAKDYNKIYLVIECGDSKIDDDFIDIKVEEDEELIQQVFNTLFQV